MKENQVFLGKIKPEEFFADQANRPSCFFSCEYQPICAYNIELYNDPPDGTDRITRPTCCYLDELIAEYEDFVTEKGHLTCCASSVLNAFISEKEYTPSDYALIAAKLGFS